MTSPEERFFQEALTAFDRATDRVGLERCGLRIGPVTWDLRFAGPAFRDRMLPACAHLLTDPDNANWTVRFFDSTTTQSLLPPPPFALDELRSGGTVERYQSGRFHFHYQAGLHVLSAIDVEARVGVYWVPDLRDLPWWEGSFPLRLMIHWAYADTPLQPLHAGAVGLPEGGVLVSGPSGAGKSTSTLTCLNSDLQYAGDDYVLADCGPEPEVYSLYSTAKVEPHNLDRLSFLKGWVSNPDRLHEQKAMVYLADHQPEKLISQFPIKAIVLPKVTGERDTLCVPASRLEAMNAISRTCLIHLPYRSDALLRKVGDLCRTVPVYSLRAGTDLPQIPQRLQELIASLS